MHGPIANKANSSEGLTSLAELFCVSLIPGCCASHTQIALEHQERIVHAVDVAALVAVAGVHARADEAVAAVMSLVVTS